MALEIKDAKAEVVEQVGMLLDWDETIVNMPSQNEFRERVVSFLLDALQKSMSLLRAERVLRILDIVRGSLSPEGYLDAMNVAVQAWMRNGSEERLLDLEWVQSFVARTKDDLYPSFNLSQRGQLDRLADSLRLMGLEETCKKPDSIALEDVVFASR